LLKGKGNLEDVGKFDAINDFLQEIGLVKDGETFYKLPKQK